MIALWVVVGLVIATISVSVLAAAFSVSGLADLFTGATTAVIAMASSLEFAKFVLAAYLHQTWNHLNLLFRTYLLAAIVVLSVITSMGIFGFLSNAYEATTSTLEGETIKINSLRADLQRVNDEIARVNKSIDEIPLSRITKKMKARTEAEPILASLQARITEISKKITAADLHILEVKKKVGPLIYIARAFKVDIDSVVKYLILVFVTVFDPLAICLVLASSHAQELRRRMKYAIPVAPHPLQQQAPFTGTEQPLAPVPPPQAVPQSTAAPVATGTDPSGDVIQMRFTEDDKNAV